MSTNQSIRGVYAEALNAAYGPRPHLTAKDPARELEILFYGMMCFDPLPDGSGYRVLFPNGLDLPDLVDIPVHAPGVWVRDREASATARWSGFAFRNDFFVEGGKHQLTITGLAKTPLDTTDFEGRVTDLRSCDPEFTISDDPDAVLEMIVDRGTLSAHVVNAGGMIVVRWAVQVEPDTAVRFTVGNDFIEISPDVTQVFLANVSAASSEETIRHFQLYRKLSKNPSRPLPFRPPARNAALNTLVLNEPTFGYESDLAPAPQPEPPKGIGGTTPWPGGFMPIVGSIQSFTGDAFTPEVFCSAVVSRPRLATG